VEEGAAWTDEAVLALNAAIAGTPLGVEPVKQDGIKRAESTANIFTTVFLVFGLFSVMGRELSLTLVGAILTIAGYSINDTIVVFDRIREGLSKGERGTISQIMNTSINETLSRTVLTGGATLIPILCLFLFGGTVLRDFALAILIGVLVGTYSSIFIASPIVLWWTKLRSGSTRALRDEVTQKTTTAAPTAAR
jgi:preprotein translocase subunit SecF